jgi:hypothetical protein
MNYIKIYIKLCKRGECRNVDSLSGYEKHHTFPKSIFGTNNRVSFLTIREHYIAHWLLYKFFVKRYGLKDVKTIKMATAFHIMVYGKNSKRNFNNFSSRLYLSARLACLNAKSGKKRTDLLGKKYFGANESTIKNGIKKMAEKKTGLQLNYPKNRKSRGNQSEETKQLISEIRLKTNNKYINMDKQEFLNWMSKFNKYMSDGKRNNNITRAILARGESISDYYD